MLEGLLFGLYIACLCLNTSAYLFIFRLFKLLIGFSTRHYVALLFLLHSYGQTASGKTFTMIGGDKPEEYGLLPRLAQGLFEYLASDAVPPKTKIKVEVSMIA